MNSLKFHRNLYAQLGSSFTFVEREQFICFFLIEDANLIFLFLLRGLSDDGEMLGASWQSNNPILDGVASKGTYCCVHNFSLIESTHQITISFSKHNRINRKNGNEDVKTFKRFSDVEDRGHRTIQGVLSS